MSGTYKVTGINLKAVPLSETDRLLTILTREQGLVRAIAPGARKHKSRFAGRSSLFVVNNLLLAEGRNLDRITQAETVCSFPKLSLNLAKLTAAQYLTEIVLAQALSHQSQDVLFNTLLDLLNHLEQTRAQAETTAILVQLNRGILQLLTLAGLAPRLDRCGRTQQSVQINWQDPTWRVGFSVWNGGIITLDWQAADTQPQRSAKRYPDKQWSGQRRPPVIPLTALDLAILRHLQMTAAATPEILPVIPGQPDLVISLKRWLQLEQLLRQYTQHHLECEIRSAELIAACFLDPHPQTSLA